MKERIREARIVSLDGPNGIRILDRDAPEAEPNQVVVDVRSIGLNRAEAMLARGQYLMEPKLPNPLGFEGVGTLRTLGAGVTGLQLGARVGLFCAGDLQNYGAAAEQVAVPTSMLLPDVPTLSDDAMAAFWVAYLTAYCGMVQTGGLSEGETVLITAASSSVGLAAIQVANRCGARPVATTRTDRKRAALLEAGAQRVIVTDTEPLAEGGEGFDLVFDAVGAPVVSQLGDLMNPKGRIVLYGVLSGTVEAPFPLFQALKKDIRMQAFHLGYQALSHASRRVAAFEWLQEAVEAGALHPVVDRRFSFSEIAKAYAHLESSNQVGKVVVAVP